MADNSQQNVERAASMVYDLGLLLANNSRLVTSELAANHTFPQPEDCSGNLEHKRSR